MAKKFPSTAQALRQIVARRTALGAPLLRTHSDLAGEIEKNESVVRLWMSGHRCPPLRDIRAIVTAILSPRAKAVDVERYTKELENAIKLDQSTAILRDPIDILVTSRLGSELSSSPATRNVNVGLIDYDPFSSGDIVTGKLFFDELFRMFLGFAGARIDPNDHSPIDLLQVRRSLCQDLSRDIVGPLFATPDRALSLTFFMTPISIKLNAIAPLSAVRHYGLEYFRRLLTGTRQENSACRPHFIVCAGEAGDLHVTNFLGVDHDSVSRIDVYDSKKFCDAFSQRVIVDGEEATPIIVTDEIMCISVLLDRRNRMEHAGRTLLFSLAPGGRVSSPEESSGAIADGHPTDTASSYFMPSYQLSFCVNRNFARWSGYLSEALDIFLLANRDHITRLYLELFNHVKSRAADWIKSMRAMSPELGSSQDAPVPVTTKADDIAARMLGLNDDSEHLIRHPALIRWSGVIAEARRLRDAISR